MAAFFITLIVLPLALIVFWQRRNKVRFWAALVIAVFLAGALAVYFFPHCVPRDALSHIQRGTAHEDVIRLLGSPVSTKQLSEGRAQIGYRKPFRYCTVDVFFDSSGHVDGIFHDH